MKIRHGFVSNSSSSSFVVAGVKVREDAMTDELIDEIDYSKLNLFYPGEGGAPDGYYVIGLKLCDCEDWGILESETSLPEVMNRMGKVVEQVAKLGVKIDGEPAIFTGTYPS